MASTTTSQAPRVSQTELASYFGVDRTTVRNMQKAGLPYIRSGRGKAAEYIAPLSFHWFIGYQVSRDSKAKLPDKLTKLRGPLDPVALAVALAETAGGEILTDNLASHLREVGQDHAADNLIVQAAYFRGLLGG